MIRAAFIYQIQPLNADLRPFVIHIKETINGKANTEIIDLLYQISKISKNMNINIRAFSFDGDNAYSELNQQFYISYTKTLFERSNIFNIHLNFKRISPDPLHLYKRLRYRLLSNRIHSGFSRKNPFIDLFRLRAVLKHLPSSVFNNTPISKMHDELPLSLFSVHSLKILYEKKNLWHSHTFFQLHAQLFHLKMNLCQRNAGAFCLNAVFGF